jgi:segregation and condensation protein A
VSEDLLVKLQIYEGPLDLLLHLIKKNEVNLDDIPVALITAQYLEYLDLMESMNVELASDFLVMAATLTQIKSRLLLPREDDDLETDPADDLKAAIIDPLLAHLRQGLDYRDVAEALKNRYQLNSDVFVRGGNPLAEDEAEDDDQQKPLEASLFDLMDAFRRLAEKKVEKRTLKFVVESKTIGERISEIQTFLKENKRGSFELICAGDKDQGDLVLSFLAVLELARTSFLRLYQNFSKSPELMVFLANPDAEVSGLESLGY